MSKPAPLDDFQPAAYEGIAAFVATSEPLSSSSSDNYYLYAKNQLSVYETRTGRLAFRCLDQECSKDVSHRQQVTTRQMTPSVILRRSIGQLDPARYPLAIGVSVCICIGAWVYVFRHGMTRKIKAE